jgi:hypothetical protein
MRRSALVALMVLACACAAGVGAGCAKADRDGDVDAGGGDDAPPGADAPPADANDCVTQPCDILTQCGCNSVQACDIDLTDLDGTACRAIDSEGTETSECESTTACDRGYVCLGNDAGSSCKRYCDDNLDCEQPRGQCVIEITDGTNPIPGIPTACSSNCIPSNVAAGGCPTGFKCGMFTQTFEGTDYNISDCQPAGAGGQGASCEVANVPDDALCAPDFLCTTVDGDNFNCRRICTRPSGPECPGSTDCLGFDPAYTLAGTEYGVCN